jgi:putative FmdB family regulatory protein
MPIYEYVCQECEKRFDALRSMSEADAVIPCESCGSERTSRALSVFFAQSGGKVVAGSNGGCGSCTANSCSSCGI